MIACACMALNVREGDRVFLNERFHQLQSKRYYGSSVEWQFEGGLEFVVPIEDCVLIYTSIDNGLR